jgi:GTP:adenosylcobinamide-phosphate guanylyltransferase
MNKVDVLILAGGNLSEDLQKYSAGYDNRALLKIGGKYMIEYVVDALRGAPEIGDILVVGLKEPLEKVLGSRVTEVVEARDSMFDNLRLGVDRFARNDRLLIATCDIPLIDAQIVARFLDTCKKKQVDLYYPIVEKIFNDQKFPTTKRTYFRLKEGVFTGGNIVLMNPAAFSKNWDYVERAIAARKSPMKLVKIIGFGFIIRFLLKQLSLPILEKKIEGILGLKGTAVMVEDPEIGVDVDKESDYLLVKEKLERRG